MCIRVRIDPADVAVPHAWLSINPADVAVPHAWLSIDPADVAVPHAWLSMSIKVHTFPKLLNYKVSCSIWWVVFFFNSSW